MREVVRPSRGPRDPRLSAGLAPLPRERDRDDDVSPIASTSGHFPMGAYHSSEEPVSYNHVEALKELVSYPFFSVYPCSHLVYIDPDFFPYLMFG